MKRFGIVVVLALVLVPAAAAAETGSWCMSWYADPFDAQQAAQRHVLANGPRSTITFACAAPEHPYVVAYRVTRGGCVGIPETPYAWKTFASATEAAAEYDVHATADARGIVSTHDGVILVYWTKQTYAAK